MKYLGILFGFILSFAMLPFIIFKTFTQNAEKTINKMIDLFENLFN